MKRRFLYSAAAAAAVVVAGSAAALPGADGLPPASADGLHAVHVCSTHPKRGYYSCLSMTVVDGWGRRVTSQTPDLSGFTPQDVQQAYHLAGLKSHGRTVAIVDAFAYKDLVSDLSYFRKSFGLPDCTVESGCLAILNQRGGRKPPKKENASWRLEQALDLDMVSSACPDCTIVIVQADTNSGRNLRRAVDTAAERDGVVAISNSYGGGNGRNRPEYDHPGIAVTASTGDSGFQGGMYPASDTHVIAVGGTAIVPDGSKRGYRETAWSRAGSGCSKRNKAPRWQRKAHTTCRTDATADVSGPAAPGAGGLIVYVNGHFTVVGGTSEASPMIAAVYALSGKTQGYPARYLYKADKHLYDIKEGRNGRCGPPLCDAGRGWDGPTGLGTPNGVKAF
jgi:subtilase family serine protease